MICRQHHCKTNSMEYILNEKGPECKTTSVEDDLRNMSSMEDEIMKGDLIVEHSS